MVKWYIVMNLAGAPSSIFGRARMIKAPWQWLAHFIVSMSLSGTNWYVARIYKCDPKKYAYQLIDNGQAILCSTCGMASYSAEDIEKKYCGNCCQFHDVPRR